MILADYCPLDALFYRNHGKLFRFITSLIFNGFSIRKKFRKAETQGFPTIAFMVCHVKSMGAFTAGQSHVFSKFLFQLGSPLILVTAPVILGWRYSYFQCHSNRSLLVVCYFYQSSEWSPMGQKGTGPKFVTRSVCVSS